VNPAIHDRDPACALDAIVRAEGRIRGVVRAHADLFESEIERLHRGGVRGVRFPFAKELGREFDAQLVQTLVPRMERFGWIAQFHIDDDALERHADTIGRVPLPVVIDGFAGIVPAAGVEQPRCSISCAGRTFTSSSCAPTGRCTKASATRTSWRWCARSSP
jgi:predicted TIM-barrel fold metal-dependent hydrolase